MTSDATVFVVDDEPRVRTSLRRLLESASLQAETYASAEEFLDDYKPRARGCLIIDVCLERMSGLELQQQVLARGIALPIIFISGYADVRHVVQAVQAGAVDFLEKPFDDECFLSTVAQALEKNEHVKRENAWRARVDAHVQTLTPRERQVIDLLLAGNHNKAISLKLGISVKTVDVHRAKVLGKMQADSLVHLANLMHRLKGHG